MAKSQAQKAAMQPQAASTKPAAGSSGAAVAQRAVKCIATTAELKAFLKANGGRLHMERPQVVGIDFALADTCRGHMGRPCVAAVAIASNVESESALVLLLNELDTNVLANAFEDLCADNNVTKVTFAVQGAAAAWHNRFDEHLLSEQDDSSVVKSVDLQLLLEHAVDAKRHNPSIAQLTNIAAVYGKLNTSASFTQQHPQLNSCLRSEITSKLRQRLVQNAQLLAIIYMGLRLVKQPIGAGNAQKISANDWKQRLAQVTKLTSDRCVQAVTNAGGSRGLVTKTASSQPHVNISTSTNSSEKANHSQSFDVVQRLTTLISTTAQLETFLAGNGNRLVPGNPQVVGIDFMLIDHHSEHVPNDDSQTAPWVSAIVIASDNAAEPALVISPQNIDPDLLVDAFQGLWTDVNVTKAMFALRLPSVAWYSRLKSHLVDESKSASKATTEDLQSLLEQAMDHGEHVIPESSTIKKCVDLQLLLEHVIDSKCRDATVLQLATVAKIDAAANQLALSNFSYKSVTASNAPSHRHASCSREAVKMVDLQRMVQNAQLFATIYTSLRMLPLPLGSDEPSIVNATEWKQKLAEVTRMTADRCVNAVANKGVPSIWFDKRADFQPRSLECLVPNRVHMDTDGEDEDDDTESNTDEDVLPLHRLELQCDIDPLLAVLPHKYRDAVMRIDGFRDRLVDVCLDVGRAPYAYVGKRQRVPLDVQDDWGSGTAVVSKADVEEILALLGGEERIGSDNRAGIDAQLHRVSVMRSKTREVYGVTMRVGRALFHAASALSDLLLSAEHREKSVLLLGHPGSGKTTLIRDVARCVSETQENVCIIDTSNEIGGDGLVPHACVGWARRMMVPSLEMQASVMIECVQNHTVETMVVDEIGRKAEVLAASTVRQRGPRLVASAHGDFRSLLNNPDLKGLVGGTQQVTVGDAAAKASGFKGKLRTERAGNPIFDVIVELDRQSQGVCHIIWDVGSAVDSVLAGEQVSGMETRRWNASTRGVQVLS
jgi:stage III sporulation protein SpoIIIAA